MPQMDVFSMGCVLAELFTDGKPLFSLARLLAFRAGEDSRDVVLAKVRTPPLFLCAPLCRLTRPF